MPVDSSFFDRRAATWERDCYPPPVRARLRALIADFDVGAGENVLDVGTGPGILLPYLIPRVAPHGRVCAVDYSFGMARQARRQPSAGRCLVARCDAQDLPFAEGRFHRVICFAALPHFTDTALSMREMGRVLRPGGTLVVAHLMSRAELAAHHAAYADVAGDVLPESALMRRLFEQAGMKPLEIVDVPGRYLAKGLKPL